MGHFQRVCVFLKTRHLTQVNLLLIIAPASIVKSSKDIQFLDNCIFYIIEIHVFSVIVSSRKGFSFLNSINSL